MHDRFDTPEKILRWRSRQHESSAFRYERIPLSQARRWRLKNGRIEHDTAHFFSVVGVEAKSPGKQLDGRTQPMIAQPEIGTLGFLFRRNGLEFDILVQAKTEPGNVGAVQLAPSVQATLSNQDRLHGGAATPYLEHFLDGAALSSDQLQSEQGTRFVAKYNRNVTRTVAGSGPAPAGHAWRWCSVRSLLALLHHDYVVNTDARSVLVCSPWELLGPNGTPFSLWQGAGNFGEDLFRSHEADDNAATYGFNALLDRLAAARSAGPVKLRYMPVDRLRGWTFEDIQVADHDRQHFRVGYHRIHTLDREVLEWDQPLLRDFHVVDAVLICQRRKGILQFLLRHAGEIGFREGVQFGPTLQFVAAIDNFAGDGFQSRLAALVPHSIAHADYWASDEGGRFDHNRVRYRIVELPPDVSCEDGPSGSWATLAQIRALLKLQGALTNEARSALSLLLPFLWQEKAEKGATMILEDARR